MATNSQSEMRTRTSTTVMLDDGILCTRIIPGSEITIEDAKDSVSVGIKLSNGKKVPVMVVFGKIKSISRDARIFFAGEHTAEYTLAIGLVIDSKVGSIIGNFMIGLNRTIYPTRLFRTEAEALTWLRTFLRG